MQMDVDLDDADEDGNIMLTLHLWKADGLTGILEVSTDGTITKVDAQAALILGCQASTLHRQHVSRRVSPSHLLGNTQSSYRMGGLKLQCLALHAMALR